LNSINQKKKDNETLSKLLTINKVHEIN